MFSQLSNFSDKRKEEEVGSLEFSQYSLKKAALIESDQIISAQKLGLDLSKISEAELERIISDLDSNKDLQVMYFSSDNVITTQRIINIIKDKPNLVSVGISGYGMGDGICVVDLIHAAQKLLCLDLRGACFKTARNHIDSNHELWLIMKEILKCKPSLEKLYFPVHAEVDEWMIRAAYLLLIQIDTIKDFSLQKKVTLTGHPSAPMERRGENIEYSPAMQECLQLLKRRGCAARPTQKPV